MSKHWLPLSLCVALLWAGVIRAQVGPNYGSQNRGDAINPNTAVSTNYDRMYEDIEIMRRILDGKLQGLYPSQTYQTFGMVGMQGGMGGMGGMQSGMGMAGGAIPVSIPIRSLEGVYLKGQGVVYTATLSSLRPPAKSAATSSLRWRKDIYESDNEWDTIRRQILNEKELPKKAEVSKPPTLSDLLLKTLADNGHHFSQLSENESLTLVLTLHEVTASSAAPKSGTGAAKAEMKSATSNRSPEDRSQLRDLELLGELHLKQGKAPEAIAVFLRLLEQSNSSKQQAELLRKLAQCHLMLGQDEMARNELDKAIILLKKETDPKEKPLSARHGASLPAKVIISAPKKLLDQAKRGKMTFEEFCLQARVQTLRFDERRSKD